MGNAYDHFLSMLPNNTYVRVPEGGTWRFGADSGEPTTPDRKERLRRFSTGLENRMRKIRLPDLLIQVDNEVHFTRHLLRSPRWTSGGI